MPLQSEPARYLHADLEVRPLSGRGRGVIATRTIRAGELLLLDTPLATAESYEVLLEVLGTRSRDDEAFRRKVLSMCGDASDEAARAKVGQPPSKLLLRNIVRHNYHGVDPTPINGELLLGEPTVGLWPLGSLVNHSLRPNVTRTFAGHCSCYRSIKPIAAGEEVLDNYLDLRLPRSMRQDMMRRNHGMDDEGPDACDAAAASVEEVQAACKGAMAHQGEATQEVAQASFVVLAGVTNKIMEIGVQDPVFADVFRDFALLAGQLGDVDMSLQGLAQAIEFATAREPYSVISYVLALRMLHMACLAKGEVDAQTRGGVEALARKHFKLVFGPLPGAFEALNPKIVRQLAELSSPSSAPAFASGGPPVEKRPRTE